MPSILFLTEGEHVPSTRYRILALVPYLEALGYQCTIRHCRPNKYLISKKRWFWPLYEMVTSASRLWQIRDANHFDLIFLQRDLVRWKTPWLERLLHRKNDKIIFDIDDAQWLFSSEEKIRKISKLSRYILAGNKTLQAFFQPLQSEHLPTIVDVSHYPIKKHTEEKPLIIGWTGTTFNYPFFNGTRALFSSLLAEGEVELHIISNGGQISELEGLPVIYHKWSPETELTDLARFDIGIMPLPDNELTRNKCGLKLIQYMAVGIPSVASAVGANCDIIIEGKTGYLCQNFTEWGDRLCLLINNKALRDQMGSAARQHAERYYNAPTTAQRLAELFQNVLSSSSKP